MADRQVAGHVLPDGAVCRHRATRSTSLDTIVRCYVNGELRQKSNTRPLIFDMPTIIETLSAGITLCPGDIIATGTPAGVGIGFEPPKYLKNGDVVRIEIDRHRRAGKPVRGAERMTTLVLPEWSLNRRARARRSSCCTGWAAPRTACSRWCRRSSGFRLVRPDLPGAGSLADARRQRSRSRCLPKRSPTCARPPGRRQRAHVVGHSFGTLVAQHLAARETGHGSEPDAVRPDHRAARRRARTAAGAGRARPGGDGMVHVADQLVGGTLSGATRTEQSAGRRLRARKPYAAGCARALPGPAKRWPKPKRPTTG